MKIEDNRRENKCIMFKDLEAGRVFEHVELNVIMIKLGRDDFLNHNRNAVRIDNATELWNISPDSKVIPVNAKLVIEE